MQQVLVKALLSIAFQLLTSQALTDLFLWAARSLAKSTKTDIDDELVAVIEKALSQPKVPSNEPAVG